MNSINRYIIGCPCAKLVWNVRPVLNRKDIYYSTVGSPQVFLLLFFHKAIEMHCKDYVACVSLTVTWVSNIPNCDPSTAITSLTNAVNKRLLSSQ